MEESRGLVPASLSDTAQKILDYMTRHPEAQDTLEGLTQWWLLEREIVTQASEVQAALAELSARELILEYRSNDGRLHYSLNRRIDRGTQVQAMNIGSWADSLPFFRRRRGRATADSPGATPASGVAAPRKVDNSTETAATGAVLSFSSEAISLPEPAAANSRPRRPASFSMSITMPSLDQVTANIRDIFDNDDYLPPAAPPLPDPTLSLISVMERSVGIGNRVGNDVRGPFGVTALKGVRLEVTLRFQFWANSPNEVEDAVQNLISTLLADRDELRAAGVLRLALKNVNASETFEDGFWRQAADFTALYEEPYADTDGAESLIAQIPIKINSNFNETTTVTDEMTRWDDKDDQSAPPLILRGRTRIAEMSALYFQPGAAPSGTVTVRRTFDGASGSPSARPDFASFLSAITDPSSPDRHTEFVFASLTAFLALFTADGDTITLGDWNEDAAPDQYQSLALAIDPPVTLPLASDRFEVVFQTNKFDQPAVLYLRAVS